MICTFFHKEHSHMSHFDGHFACGNSGLSHACHKYYTLSGGRRGLAACAWPESSCAGTQGHISHI